MRKRVIVALLVIILAVITGFTAKYFISRSFHGIVHSDHTELFPINTENCPTVIEDKYYLSELPEGFEVLDTISSPFHEYVCYENAQTGQTIVFQQWVKSEFDSINLNTEKGELVEIEINGHSGVFLDLSNDDRNSTHAIWDNGDYILYISGNLPKNNLLDLVKAPKTSNCE